MGLEEANGIAQDAERQRRRRHWRAPLKIVLPTAAALGAGAAVAVGSIPGPTGVITGCYQTVQQGQDNRETPYGALRVIDPTRSTLDVGSDEFSCDPTVETTITWNQQGVPGAVGPQGAQGLQGAPGPAGPSGSNGANGSNGVAGSDGQATLEGNTNFSITSGAKSELFLKLGDIKGESTDDKHKDEINLESFAAGTEAPVVGSASSGAGAGKVTISTFKFVKKVDSVSPTLQKDLAAGTTLKSAEIDVLHANKGAAAQVASYKLTNLVLKSIDDNGDTETILGSFKALELVLGSGRNTVTAGWNKVKNTGSWDLLTNKQS